MPYSGNPASSPADELRFMIGDTDAANPKLSDNEVTYLLGKYERIECAAYHGASMLYSKYSGKMSKSIGSSRLEYGALARQYNDLMGELSKACGQTNIQRVGAPVAHGLRPPGPLTDQDMDNPAADYN